MKKLRLLNIIGHDHFEHNNMELFSKLGFTVQTTGVYSDPNNVDPLKPYLPEAITNYEQEIVSEFKVLNPSGYVYGKSKLTLDKPFVDKFDVILFSWIIEPLLENPDLFKDKIIIYQSFGQSSGQRECLLQQLKARGLKIVRMSEYEKFFPSYVGSDATIDLHIDTDYYSGWLGGQEHILTVNSAFAKRSQACNVPAYLQATNGFPRKLYGTHNEDYNVPFNYGAATREIIREQYRNSRLFLSAGTRPCPVVLSFKEAMSVGCPVITWGPRLGGPTFAAHTYIENGVNGFYSDNCEEIRNYIQELLTNYALAESISKNSRETALKHFGMDVIGPQWKDFFKTLGVEG